ncbi:MAG: hypothetical protein BWY21_00177 [Parcubacteria group bacterium ADurb.Bin216]|nr:MAG: hypothetical protein BWY21_00177 [Parcubacteria group bacterium ADurb.Bin216]
MANPSQDFIQVQQIREGLMIMKDASMKGVLAVSSLNFALKSDEEQEAIIYNFQNFLNSLDFTCQILVTSRKVNIAGYIEKLKGIEKTQQNELLRMQTTDYRKFIEEIVLGGTIMTKSFYVVIPYYPLLEVGMAAEQMKAASAEASQGDLLGTQNTKIEDPSAPDQPPKPNPSLSEAKKINAKLTEKQFKAGKFQLNQRLEYAVLGLRRSGLKAFALDSKELIELLWSFYNPKQSEQGYYPQVPPELIT